VSGAELVPREQGHVSGGHCITPSRLAAGSGPKPDGLGANIYHILMDLLSGRRGSAFNRRYPPRRGSAAYKCTSELSGKKWKTVEMMGRKGR